MKNKFLPFLLGALFTGYTMNSDAQANQKLSNLTGPTAINQTLLPKSNALQNIGSSARQWRSIYLSDTLYLNGMPTMYTNQNNNFYVGPYSGSYNSFTSGNTGVGIHACFAWESSGNTAIGYYAMGGKASYGSNNTATGSRALYNNDDGNDNTANGITALFNNTDGYENTAVGSGALFSNTEGYGNTANGYQALYNSTTGNNVTATGHFALFSNTTGILNTANGVRALQNNTSGTRNTAIGVSAGDANTTGVRNTFIGFHANSRTGRLTNATALGNEALVSASNTVRIGNNAVTSIGGAVNWSTTSDGRVKKNIKNDVPGLAFINQLNPVTYNLDLDAADKIIQAPALNIKEGKKVVPDIEDAAVRKAKEKVVYTGFVAQEVEKAAKAVNYDFSGVDAAKNDNDLYGLRYSEFVVPLVKAVQELSQQNAALQSRIEKLEAMLTNNSSVPQTIKNATLENNAPNPFQNTTRISYTLPQSFSKAQLSVTDKNGQLLKLMSLSGAGRGSVDIDANGLASGAYSYSLYVDGNLIATKEMLLTK